MAFWKRIFKINKFKNVTELKNSKTFCIMPWVHFHVTQYGTVTPCCQAPWQEDQAFGNINEQSIKEIWQGEKIKKFRKTILEGKIDKRCESCFIREKDGFTSLRKITNEKYNHKHDLVLATNKLGEIGNAMPIYFDIRFSNVCNLRCRICGPWSSSSWFNDAIKLGMIKEDAKALTYSFSNVELFFKQLDEMIDSIEEIYFAGGEPIVMEEHYTLLYKLIKRNRTDVRLTYNTNFSSFEFKQHNIFELWKQFKTISIAASLDASEKRGEFLRKNLNWNDVIANRQLILKELPHIEFVVSATLNIYNVLHLPDFHKEWVEKKLIQVEDFIPTLLVKPLELSVRILPTDFKLAVIAKYKEHLNWIESIASVNREKRIYMIIQFENIIKALSVLDATESIDLFRKNSQAMDKVRDEKTLDIFPELKALFE
jgi:radical SAM protein with 4Fe4S-binding SPASM domain